MKRGSITAGLLEATPTNSKNARICTYTTIFKRECRHEFVSLTKFLSYEMSLNRAAQSTGPPSLDTTAFPDHGDRDSPLNGSAEKRKHDESTF